MKKLMAMISLLSATLNATEITINENGESTITGLQKNGEVYIPFSYLEEKYKLYGTFSNDQFNLQHSNRSLTPFEPYLSQGQYLNFKNYYIQHRSAIRMDDNGVPRVKYSWGIEYNPTTIAQYALQLYSQTIDSKGSDLIPVSASWELYTGSPLSASITEVYDEIQNKQVKVFYGASANNLELQHGFKLSTKENLNNLLYNNIVSWKFKPEKNFRFHFVLDTNKGIKYLTYYDGNDGLETPSIQGDYLYIPLQTEPNSWSTIARNIEHDAKLLDPEIEPKTINDLLLRGNLSLSDIKLIDHSEFESFYTQTDWLVNNQDQIGGWPYGFDFLFFANRVETMESGWYSAIAQGTAISALTRAYQISAKPEYLDSAKSAIEIYNIPVEDGGILRFWQNNTKFPFYEEYPTSPASFVLNGYQFALLGAYDLWQVTGTEEHKEVYKKGIDTLSEVLPLYDTGHRTSYDLTHYTAKSFPNHASWHYHTVHIDMMKAINHIEMPPEPEPAPETVHEPKYSELIERWEKYLKGHHKSRD